MNDDRTPLYAAAGDELPTEWLNRLKLAIPGYRLLNEINRGGQAIVYRAEQQSTGRIVAVKVLREGPLADEAARERFRREVRALAVLENHPHIVPIIDSGTAEGYDYLVMKHLVGKPLDKFLFEGNDAESGQDDAAFSLKLFLKICQAVAAAHRLGVVHRDLSPSNILIDEQGSPHILDFGLARTPFDRFMRVGNAEPSMTGQFLGKLAYASPEQAEGCPEKIDPRTDVYALGVILYQILTGGQFPYEVVGKLADVLNNIIHVPPVPPSTRSRFHSETLRNAPVLKQRQPPLINPTIEAIVLMALAKHPAARYESAAELGKDIENYLHGQPTIARAAASIARPRRLREPPLWLMLATAAILAGVLAWTASVWLGGQPPASKATQEQSP